MNLSWLTIVTYCLLAIAICSLWLRPVQIGTRLSISPWIPCYLASIAMGYLAGHLAWQGVLSLALFSAVAYAAATNENKILRVILRVITGLMVLALYMHKFPGFIDATVGKDVVVTAGARTIDYHANFGAISTGLILIALFCNPIQRAVAWKVVVRQAMPIAGMSVAAVLGLAMVIGYVQVDFKLPQYTLIFLVVNLLFTCVAEEAFFRGFLQEQLMRAMSTWRSGPYLAALVGALLFAVAHVKGGSTFILLAGIAGIFNAYAYLKTKRVEASIICHYTLNAVHFIAFTYPHI